MIKFKQFDFWCCVGQLIYGSKYGIERVGQPEVTYGTFSTENSIIHITSGYTVESVHYTDEKIQVKQKIKGWSISNDKGVVPDFTLVRYVGEQNDYYYTSGGGSVTPETLTPNFEFPITAGDLFEKTMTASSPVTADDLVNGLVFYSNTTPWNIVHNQTQNRYEISDGANNLNSVLLSEDGLTISFGSFGFSGPTFTSFTFNA